MRKIAYLLLFLLPFSFAAVAQEDKSLFLDAVALYSEGEFSAAGEMFARLLEQKPDDDAYNYYMGSCEFYQGRTNQAAPYIEKAAALDSANLWYIHSLAMLYSQTGERVKFADSFQKLIDMRPAIYRTPYSLTMIADVRLAQGRDSLALARYGEALDIDPQYLPARLGKLETYRMSGKTPSFFTELRQLIEDGDVDAGTKSAYLEAIMQNMDSRFYWVWGSTLKELTDRCVELYPLDYKCNMLKFQLLYIEQDYEGALKQCAALQDAAVAAADSEKLAEAYNYEGDLAHMLGDRKRAYRCYDNALSLKPDICSVLNNYAYYLSEEKKQLKKALKMSRRAVELEPDNATYLDTLGWILYLMKKPEEAKPHFKRAMIFGGKESAVVLEHYSLVLRALGEDDLADYYHSLSEQKSETNK